MTEQRTIVGIGYEDIACYGSLVQRAGNEIEIRLPQEPLEDAFARSPLRLMVLESGHIQRMTARVIGAEGRRIRLECGEDIQSVRRRVSTRFSVELPVFYEKAGAKGRTVLQTIAVDISLDGMCLRENPSAPLPDELNLSFCLPHRAAGATNLKLLHERTLKVTARVTNRRILKKNKECIGVMFVDISPENQAILNQFLEDYAAD